MLEMGVMLTDMNRTTVVYDLHICIVKEQAIPFQRTKSIGIVYIDGVTPIY